MYVPGFDDPTWAAAFPERVGSPATGRRKPGEWTIPIEVRHEGSPSSRGNSPPKESSEEESRPQGPRVHHIPITVEPRDSGPSTRPRQRPPAADTWDNGRQRAHSFGNRFFRQPADEEEVPSPRPARTRHSSGEKKPHVTKVFVNQQPQPSTTPPPQTTEPPEHRSLTKIKEIVRQIEDLREKVNSFEGEHQDKQYRYLDEMLTRCMIMLDDVETEGLDDIRQARKAAVRMVEDAISHLESKVHKKKLDATAESQEPMEVVKEVATENKDETTKETTEEEEDVAEVSKPEVEQPSEPSQEEMAVEPPAETSEQQAGERSQEEMDATAMEEASQQQQQETWSQQQEPSSPAAATVQRSEVTIQLGGEQPAM